MIKLLINKKETPFEVTKFPDGTSQVWKIQGSSPTEKDTTVIQWLFENEAELFQVCQLSTLLYKKCNVNPILDCPYLPYGRQDKNISNSTSFAQKVFMKLVRISGILHVQTYDAHSLQENIVSRGPHEFHLSVFDHDVICFPDKGALYRYGTANGFHGAPYIYCNKVRDQLTGEITGLEIDGNIRTQSIEDLKILIVDDICDGGMTFIKVTEELNKFKPKQVDLAVSHGLFTKGKQCLHDAGITNIYTTNSLLRNPEGFKVW